MIKTEGKEEGGAKTEGEGGGRRGGGGKPAATNRTVPKLTRRC